MNINLEEGYWDKKWSGCHALNQYPFQKEVDQIISDWVKPNIKVLDLGCGTGSLMLKIREDLPNINITGLDLSSYAVKVVKAHGFKAKVAKVPPIPYKDKSFDLVIAEELLEHVDKDDELLEEMIRVGKECIISVPEGLMYQVVKEHVNYYNELELRNKLKELGQKFEFKKTQKRLVFRFAKKDEFKESPIKNVALGIAAYGKFYRETVMDLLAPYGGAIGDIQHQVQLNILGKTSKFIVPENALWLPSYIYFFSSCNIVFCRNEIVKKFLETDSEWLWSLDVDMDYQISRIKGLIDKDKDIIGGLYKKRMPGEISTLAKYDPKVGMTVDFNYPTNEVYSCDGLGMGATVIKRDVFLKIPYPWFEYLYIGPSHKVSREPFDGGNMTGSDWSFMYKAKYQHGFQIYCDTSFLCGHIGEKTFIPSVRGEA